MESGLSTEERKSGQLTRFILKYPRKSLLFQVSFSFFQVLLNCECTSDEMTAQDWWQVCTNINKKKNISCFV